MTPESRISVWVRTRLGPDHMQPQERAMRLVEEAIEHAQAVGITADQIARLTAHVYERPAGDAVAELGGVAVCLAGCCAAHDTTVDAMLAAELARIEARPVEDVQASLSRKAEAGLVAERPIQVGDLVTPYWWCADRPQRIYRVEKMGATMAFFVEGGFWPIQELRRVGD